MAVKYGIIGAGMMGREHIQNILLLENTVIEAIVEPHSEQQKISKELAGNPKVYSNIETALNSSSIDAWVIASPNFTHKDTLASLMQTGKPILIEKPLCTTFEQCEEVEKMALSYPAPIWVAMEYRYMQAISMLLQRVQEGVIGEVKMISIREHRFPFLKKVNNWNRFNKYTGGTLVEKCCHFFDLIYLIAQSEATGVYASGGVDVNFLEERYEGRAPDMLDNAYVVLDFACGKRALLELCMFCDGSYFQEEITVIGDKGKIEAKIPGPDRLWAVDNLKDLGHSTGFRGMHRASELVSSPRSPKKPITEKVLLDEQLQSAGDHNGSTFFQNKKFNDVVQGQGEVEVSVNDGLKAVRVGLAAELSIKERKFIKLS